jgi:hypothetical protein
MIDIFYFDIKTSFLHIRWKPLNPITDNDILVNWF